MAKLRKTLGDVNSQTVKDLMNQIDTQSKETIALWCLELAEKYVVEIVKDKESVEPSLQLAKKLIAKEIKASELKAINKQLQQMVSSTKDPIQQAALRAIHQACSVYYNPTSTLGFGFYASAATCYHKYGLEASEATYDCGAAQFFEIMLETLKQCSKENVEKPVKAKWNC